jgi:hypothetical protein
VPNLGPPSQDVPKKKDEKDVLRESI